MKCMSLFEDQHIKWFTCIKAVEKKSVRQLLIRKYVEHQEDTKNSWKFSLQLMIHSICVIYELMLIIQQYPKNEVYEIPHGLHLISRIFLSIFSVLPKCACAHCWNSLITTATRYLLVIFFQVKMSGSKVPNKRENILQPTEPEHHHLVLALKATSLWFQLFSSRTWDSKCLSTFYIIIYYTF